MRSTSHRVVTCALAASLLAASVPAEAVADTLSPAMEHAHELAATKLAATQAIIPAGQFPFYTTGPTWKTVNPRNWGSSFMPGSMWYQYQRTGASRWRDWARARQRPIEPYKTDTGTHDLGFLMLNTFRLGYRLTGDAAYRDTALIGARSLSQRFDPDVGMVRSRTVDGRFVVITDTMMNIELLLWAANNGGDPRLRDKATSHALRTAADFIRPDGSSYHYVSYSETTGAVIDRGTSQGAFDESTWSRGHAWLIYGLAAAYRETGDPRLLDAAHRTTDYWTANVPEDLVPYWDFDVPGIPDAPRDSSAAAIAASAFVELGRIDPDAGRRADYLALARDTLESLSSAKYLAGDAPELSMLLHGTFYGRTGSADHGTSWGDYYFTEALMRLRTQVLRVAGPDRYEAAVRTSQLGFERADTVVVAGGTGFADALAASSLAGAYGAPVLLTRPTSVPASVAREVKRLGAKAVWIVGGPSSVSEEVARDLDALPGVAVGRIGGRDRYEVAASVAARVVALRGGALDGRALLVRGDIFPDALSVSPVAYWAGMPVLLTRPTALPAATAAALRSAAFDGVVVCGGTASVSDGIERSLRASGRYASVTRVSGRDRYAVAAAFARWAQAQKLAGSGFVGVASGLDYPDALVGGAAAGARRGVLILTRRDQLPGETAEYLGGAGVDTGVWLFGGETRVLSPVENALRNALPEQ